MPSAQRCLASACVWPHPKGVPNRSLRRNPKSPNPCRQRPQKLHSEGRGPQHMQFRNKQASTCRATCHLALKVRCDQGGTVTRDHAVRGLTRIQAATNVKCSVDVCKSNKHTLRQFAMSRPKAQLASQACLNLGPFPVVVARYRSCKTTRIPTDPDKPRPPRRPLRGRVVAKVSPAFSSNSLSESSGNSPDEARSAQSVWGWLRLADPDRAAAGPSVWKRFGGTLGTCPSALVSYDPAGRTKEL